MDEGVVYMIKIYEKKIEYGLCDTNACLKLTEIVKIIEAAVASFYGVFHKDNLTLKKEYNAAWLFTKTRFEIERLPLWDEDVVIEAERVSYESKLLSVIKVYIHPKNLKEGIYGWVETALADIPSRRLLRLSGVQLDIPMEESLFSGYSKWEDLEGFKESYKLQVTQGYLDYSRHVNNAEYVRMLMDCFTLEEIEKMNIRTVEIHYLKESYEKDELHILKAKHLNSTYFRILRDVPILEMKMEERQ